MDRALLWILLVFPTRSSPMDSRRTPVRIRLQLPLPLANSQPYFFNGGPTERLLQRSQQLGFAE